MDGHPARRPSGHGHAPSPATAHSSAVPTRRRISMPWRSALGADPAAHRPLLHRSEDSQTDQSRGGATGARLVGPDSAPRLVCRVSGGIPFANMEGRPVLPIIQTSAGRVRTVPRLVVDRALFKAHALAVSMRSWSRFRPRTRGLLNAKLIYRKCGGSIGFTRRIRAKTRTPPMLTKTPPTQTNSVGMIVFLFS